MTANFLEAAGTNGYITATFSLLTTELNTLGSTSTATSSVNGTSGKFSQSNSSNAIWGYVYFTSGGSFTATGAANISLWWLNSTDGGTTFETGTAIGRAPDCVIPLPAIGITVGQIFYAPLCRLWFPTIKIFVQNNSGVSLPASGNVVSAAGVAVAY